MPEKKNITVSGKKNVQKKTDRKAPAKKPSFFARALLILQRTLILPFRNMASELKKVSWPNRKDLTNYSIVVVTFMVLMAVVIGLLDLGTSALLQLLLNRG